MTEKNRIIIFDTTMRDGEQSPGASMSLEEKLQISRVFDELRSRCDRSWFSHCITRRF